MFGARIERRTLRALDHLRHRESLAGAGDAQQHLIALLRHHAFHQFFNCMRLIALRRIFRNEFEFDAALALGGTLGAMRRPCFLIAKIGIAETQQLIEALHRRPGAAKGRRVGAFVEAELGGEVGVHAGERTGVVSSLGGLLEAVAAVGVWRLDQTRIEQGGKMRRQRLDPGLRGFGARRPRWILRRLAGGFGHGRNMGPRGARWKPLGSAF